MSTEKQQQPTKKRRRMGTQQCFFSTDTRVLAQQQRRSRRDNYLYYFCRPRDLDDADVDRWSFGKQRRRRSGAHVPILPLVLLLTVSLTRLSLDTTTSTSTIGPFSCHAWSPRTQHRSSSFQRMIVSSSLPATINPYPQLVFGSYARRRRRSERLFASVETAETKMEHEQQSSSDGAVTEFTVNPGTETHPKSKLNGTQQPTRTAASSTTAPTAASLLVDPKEISNTIDGISRETAQSSLSNSEVVSSEEALLSSSTSTTNTNSTEDVSLPSFLQYDEEDSPKPTANGGFTHTRASRAKISAANKGKTPWNKGRSRSEETRARIAAGVRARNRERFLQKLQDLGVTEAEHEAQKAAARRRKDAERRARRTSKGGYRPTEETKRKISQILKQKYAAAGGVKRRNVDPAKVRRGFTHSEETRRKISESLRRRWASDPDYRRRMVEASSAVNTSESTRQKISASLRAKWKDPTFRAQMMEKFANRTSTSTTTTASSNYGRQTRNAEHRQKISAAMKAKWQDEEYRQKTQAAIRKRRSAATKKTAAKPAKKKQTSTTGSSSSSTATAAAAATIRPVLPKGGSSGNGSKAGPVVLGQVRMVQPRVEPRTPKKRPKRRAAASKKQPRAVQPKKRSSAPSPNDSSNSSAAARTELISDSDNGDPIDLIDDIVAGLDDMSPKKQAPAPSPRTRSKSPTGSGASGSVDLLKQHRRDLYDLLYGDESAAPAATTTGYSSPQPDDDGDSGQEIFTPGGTDKLSSVFALEDDNLDNFDPYGLEDF